MLQIWLYAYFSKICLLMIDMSKTIPIGHRYAHLEGPFFLSCGISRGFMKATLVET